ncbi:PBECR4 domain-containing protein [Macrococcus bovicus]|uniref:PBECR4 domain-containing protein n=1 Tax=Macrococcus bovicus TaxID=69968 RepID=UPI0025A5BC4C|nr:PBECR4 domain-containing protein [Macrococcus bovicus]WJP97052.1 PBECR4 domain-containing protein [Macrococcus bovicus]
MSSYMIVEKLEDVDFQDLLNDYIQCFTRQYLVMETNYNKLEKFEVRFTKTDVHHLLGFHKIQDSNVNATHTLSQILDGTLTLETARKHNCFDDMKSRLINYNFLHRCFIDQEVSLCVIPSKGKNPQNLNIVFQDKHRNCNMLIGLRRVRDYYVPVTMYETNRNGIYNSQRRTKIISAEWKDY